MESVPPNNSPANPVIPLGDARSSSFHSFTHVNSQNLPTACHHVLGIIPRCYGVTLAPPGRESGSACARGVQVSEEALCELVLCQAFFCLLTIMHHIELPFCPDSQALLVY